MSRGELRRAMEKEEVVLAAFVLFFEKGLALLTFACGLQTAARTNCFNSHHSDKPLFDTKERSNGPTPWAEGHKVLTVKESTLSSLFIHSSTHSLVNH